MRLAYRSLRWMTAFKKEWHGKAEIFVVRLNVRQRCVLAGPCRQRTHECGVTTREILETREVGMQTLKLFKT